MPTPLEKIRNSIIGDIGTAWQTMTPAIWAVFLFVSFAALSECTAEEPSVESIGRRLEQSKDPGEREAILLLIPRVAKLPHTTRLLDSISVCTRDANAEVRRAAVLALAHISFENKIDCPRRLIAALLDVDVEVRQTASANIVPDVYSALPDNTLEVAEEALTNEKYRDVRATCANLLQYSRLNDRATNLLTNAMSERDQLVRNNAAVALYAHGLAVDEVVGFYAESALAPLERREFYSNTFGWDEFESEFASLMRSQYRQRLYEAATKYPQSVAREFAERLRSKNHQMVACALAQIASPSRLSDSLVNEFRKSAFLEELKLLAQNPNSQVSDLAHLARLRLLAARESQN